MARLTDAELRAVRAWVGDVDEARLNERFDRLDDLDELVLEELMAQHSELLANPASISVEGISVSYGENLQALERKLKAFRLQGGLHLDDSPPASGPNVTKMVRPDYR